MQRREVQQRIIIELMIPVMVATSKPIGGS